MDRIQTDMLRGFLMVEQAILSSKERCPECGAPMRAEWDDGEEEDIIRCVKCGEFEYVESPF